jgi:hypothetical protein
VQIINTRPSKNPIQGSVCFKYYIRWGLTESPKLLISNNGIEGYYFPIPEVSKIHQKCSSDRRPYETDHNIMVSINNIFLNVLLSTSNHR